MGNKATLLFLPSGKPQVPEDAQLSLLAAKISKLKGIIGHLGTNDYSLCGRELDEEISTTLMCSKSKDIHWFYPNVTKPANHNIYYSQTYTLITHCSIWKCCCLKSHLFKVYKMNSMFFEGFVA